MSAHIGVDVGGTKTAAVLRGEGGEVLARSWDEHGADRETVVASIVDAIRRMRGEAGGAPVGGCRVSITGLVSADGVTVVRSAGLGITDAPLGRELAEASGLPVGMVNDADATLVGHLAAEAGERLQHGTSVLLALGTGLGGAAVVDGRLVRGVNGFAGELGHLAVDYADPRRCLCGAPGCVENYASGRGVAELAVERGLLAPEQRTPASSRIVVERAAAGDEAARDLLHDAGRMLGRAVIQLGIVFDPECFFLGGSFGHAAAHWLLPGVEEELDARWPFAAYRPRPVIRLDSVGPYAAAIGAAVLAATE